MQIGKLCSELHHRIVNIKKLTNVTNFKTRLLFIRSYVIGKLIYAMPLYMHCSAENITKIHRLIMTAARASIGCYCYKRSIKYILNKCNMMDAKNTILYSSIKFIHAMAKNRLPESLLDLYMPQNIRNKAYKFRPK